MPRIFDAFILNDELDILWDRFTELAEVPGLVHVICEAPVTFRGSPKPLYFWEARQSRFACWHGRWNHVRVEPHEMRARTPKMREEAQREFLLHGIAADPGDIVLYGDVCDIPDKMEVADLARRKTFPPLKIDNTIAIHYRDINSIAELNIGE